MASKPSCSGHFGSRLRLFLPKPPTPGPIQMPCRSVQRLTKLNIRWSVDSLGPRWSEITEKIVVVAGGQWSKLSHRELLQHHAATLSVPGAQRPIGIVGLLGSGDVLGDWSSAEPKPNRWLRLPRTHPRVQKRRADSTDGANEFFVNYLIMGFMGDWSCKGSTRQWEASSQHQSQHQSDQELLASSNKDVPDLPGTCARLVGSEQHAAEGFLNQYIISRNLWWTGGLFKSET